MAVGEPAEGGPVGESRLKAAEEAEGNPAPSASEEEATDVASLEQLTQCLIQPPTEHPYFLQLLGYNEKQVNSSSTDGLVQLFIAPQREKKLGQLSLNGCLLEKPNFSSYPFSDTLTGDYEILILIHPERVC